MKKLIILLMFPVFMPGTSFSQLIKADGITDDLPALKLAAKSGNVFLPAGLIRITDTWVIGDKPAAEQDMLSKEPLSDGNKYHNAQYTRAISISGNNTTIWLDNPDTNKSVIYYAAQGLKDDNNAATISNLTLKGKGTGIASFFTKRLTIQGVNFIGFNNGLILNNAYFFTGSNLYFNNCRRAEYDIRSHRSNFNNITLSFCKKGFEVRSNNILVNGYYASFCNTGLHVAAGNNEFHSIYLESPLAGDGQLIIGDTAGERVDGNEFNTLVIAASNPLNRGIVFLDNLGTVEFRGGGAQSTLFDVKGKPTVIVSNFKANLPVSILK